MRVRLLLVLLAACRGGASSTFADSAPPDAATDVASGSAAKGAPVASASSAASGAPPQEDAGPPVVVARGKRIVQLDRGQVVATRPKGPGVALTIAPAPRDKGAKLSATIEPFLRRADLLDVTVSERSEQGWHYQFKDMHYVLDTSGADDVLVCVFAGGTSSGGEYASWSTTIAVKQTAAKPLAFSVTTTSNQRQTQPKDHAGSSTSSAVADFEVGASSCTAMVKSP